MVASLHFCLVTLLFLLAMPKHEGGHRALLTRAVRERDDDEPPPLVRDEDDVEPHPPPKRHRSTRFMGRRGASDEQSGIPGSSAASGSQGAAHNPPKGEQSGIPGSLGNRSHSGAHHEHAEFQSFVSNLYLRISDLDVSHVQLHAIFHRVCGLGLEAFKYALHSCMGLKILGAWVFQFAQRNRLSGFTTQQMAQKATKAGAGGVEGFAKAGNAGKLRGNISRDLLKTMLKGCSLPLLYWALIPMRDPKTDQNNVLTWMPFLLVHEVLAALWDALGDNLYDPSPSVEKTLKESCSKNGVNFSKQVVLPLGVHGDGVPNQANKTIVAFTWNILALGKLSERILFAVLSKDRRH